MDIYESIHIYIGEFTTVIEEFDGNINDEFIRFQTFDSTISISGEYKGAQRKLSDMLDRKVIYIPCLPHVSDLVIEHGCNASTQIRYMFNTLEACYVLTSGSTKCHSVLKEKLENIENALQLKKRSQTRWSSRPVSIDAFWLSYVEICDLLNEMRTSNKFDTDTKLKANGFFLPKLGHLTLFLQ